MCTLIGVLTFVFVGLGVSVCWGYDLRVLFHIH